MLFAGIGTAIGACAATTTTGADDASEEYSAADAAYGQCPGPWSYCDASHDTSSDVSKDTTEDAAEDASDGD
jgi:hypothetical protein